MTGTQSSIFHHSMLNVFWSPNHPVLHLYLGIFYTAITSSICDHVSVFILFNLLPVCLPSRVFVVTHSSANMQFLNLSCNTTSRPLVGKAWGYERLHLQIQQLAEVQHGCRKEWMVCHKCSPENVKQRGRDFLHRVWTTAAMCTSSSQEWLIWNQRRLHSKPHIVKSWESSNVTLFHEQKVTVNTWTPQPSTRKPQEQWLLNWWCIKMGEVIGGETSEEGVKLWFCWRKAFKTLFCKILIERG